MKLSDILSDINDVKITGSVDKEITGIAYDSRSVGHGFVFVCISGYKTDGHNYIEEAVKRGASAIVIEKEVPVPEGMTIIRVPDTRETLALMSCAYFGYPSRDIKLIGVTGTNGKTTTSYIIKAILEEKGYKVALLGTIANIIGGRTVEAKRTTPESYDLQELFAEMKNSGMNYCVMEVSSHSLELKRVAGCQFSIGVFTNLTQDHLDFHGSFENYFNAKLKLFEQSDTAVINIDDSFGSEIIKRINAPVVTYSENSSANVRAEDIEITSRYSRFMLEHGGQMVQVSLALPGKFNVYNSLAAAAACIVEGISLDDIKKGLDNSGGIPGRSEVIDSKRGFTVIVDYAHTPDGLENILNTVREYTKGRIITLFGCGGDRDRTKRPMMGEVAGKLSDLCIVTSDNPRTEDPDSIIEDIIPGIQKTEVDFRVVTDRREAIKKALSIAEENDVVVVAGKGHETYQVLKDRTIQFDEREIINNILEKEI